MARINTCSFFDATAVTTSGTFTLGGGELRTNPTTTGTGFVTMQKPQSPGTGGTISLNTATLYVRFYFKAATLPAANSEEIFQARTTANATKFALRLGSDGKLSAYDNTGTNLLATGSTVLSSGTYYRIEVKIGTGATAAWEVKVNGTSEISGTADLNTGNNVTVCFGKVANRNGQSVDFYYKTVALDDAAYPGAASTALMTADGNGNYTAWTGVYTAVDEVPNNGSTDYILSTLSVGDAETVSLISAATAGISGTILSVKACAIVARDSAAGNIKLRVRSGSTDSDNSTGFSPPAAYGMIATIKETDPATGIAWTPSGLDALEVGVIENSATNATRCTSIFAEVEYVPASGGLLLERRRMFLS